MGERAPARGPNRATASARYSAGDFSFADEIFAPDIEWRVPVGEPIVGRRSLIRSPGGGAASGGPAILARMADEHQQSLAQQLGEIGAQLDWVRDYL